MGMTARRKILRPDEVIGRSVRLLHGPKTDRAAIDRTWNALIRGESARFETINYRKDGSECWNDVSITPTADASGRYSQLISIPRDQRAARARRQPAGA
jgi:two-component system, sensor histidine kinase and response regulator